VLQEKRTVLNLFSLLGWEAGLVAAAALRHGDYAMLEGWQFSSPRGMITLSADTHISHAPVYDAVVKKDEASGNCTLQLTGINPHADAQRALLEHDINTISGSMTSWHNAYGCLES
jgi:hypothetical protein